MKIIGVSRRALFEQLDRPALEPLPRTRYELAEWKPCRVNIDYHVEVDHNFYSVPYQLVHARVEARVTADDRRGLLQGPARVASHARLTGRGRFATQRRAHAARPSGARGMDAVAADRVGRADWPGHRPARRGHPRAPAASRAGLPRVPRADATRAALHGADRLEAACRRAERLRSYRYRTVEHILINQQDRLPLEEPPCPPALTHENVRGATYYEEAYADAPHDREAPRLAPDGDGRGL